MKPAATSAFLVQCGFELTVVGVGMLGQFYDLQVTGAEHVRVILHSLFGVTLGGAILWSYGPLLLGATRIAEPRADHRIVVRMLSRRVYLVLYGLAGFREIVSMVLGESVWQASHPATPVYLCYGLLGLIVIRMLAVIGRWRDRMTALAAPGYRVLVG